MNTEAYMPCMLALFRIQLIDAWSRYNLLVKVHLWLTNVAFISLVNVKKGSTKYDVEGFLVHNNWLHALP